MKFSYTDSQISKLISGLHSGADLTTSATAAGIDVGELLAFLDTASGRASASQKKAKTLLSQIQKARASVIIDAQQSIMQASKENWKAAAWWLERTLPEVYSSKDR